MTDYPDRVRHHRRLAILRHLEACAEYTSNASILQDMLRGVGLPTSRDLVMTEIFWLKEQGFVDLTDGGSFVVVTATHRGVDLATGIATHPEVQRPHPRA